MSSPQRAAARWSLASAEEVDAIRAALAAADVPQPFGKGAGHTATWVAVALAELQTHRDREQQLRQEAADRAAAAGQEAEGRTIAAERVRTRASRTGCPRPDKAAYDVTAPDEVRLIQRRRRVGMDLYGCVCGWSHLGHPPAVEIVDAPVLPDDPILWARSCRNVVLLTGGGTVHAEGQVVAYQDAPTVQVRTDEGQVISWRADLARASGD